VSIRISFDGILSIYSGEVKIVEHRLRPVDQGWVTIPEHHARLWRETLRVERRDLGVYEEVAACSW
jgi:hypothetical protein